MQAVSNKAKGEEERTRSLRRQIALLQAQLNNEDNVVPSETLMASPEQPEQRILLAPSTPSPKKTRILDYRNTNVSSSSQPPRAMSNHNKRDGREMRKGIRPPAPGLTPLLLKNRPPSPSKLLANLTTLKPANERDDALRNLDKQEKPEVSNRTTDFKSAAITTQGNNALQTKRDERLAIIEDLEPGPYEFSAPSHDPGFCKLEPHSSIRLRSRTTSHEDLCEVLRGRYFLSPSTLYSIVRVTTNGKGPGPSYDVPVPGDWVTIAVVAQRGEIKVSSRSTVAGVPQVAEDDADDGDDGDDDGIGLAAEDDEAENALKEPVKKKAKQGQKGKKKGNMQPPPRSRKFVTLKLVDFGCRSSSSTSQTGGVRGDALLNLTIFEADSVGYEYEEGDADHKRRRKRVYTGGSGGLFEEDLARVFTEGSVIALLNPRVMKPFTSTSTQNKGYSENTQVLGLTPLTRASVLHLGFCPDLGHCTAVTRAGNPCGSWVDRRGGGPSTGAEVCEFHLTRAVMQKRAGRAEFSVGTGGMVATARKDYRSKAAGSSDFDPVRKFGLLPAPTSEGPVSTKGKGKRNSDSNSAVSSQTTLVNAYGSDKKSNGADAGMLTEKMGREQQARARRVLTEGKEGDKSLLQRLSACSKAAAPTSDDADSDEDMDDDLQAASDERREAMMRLLAQRMGASATSTEASSKKRYSVGLVKSLGFDPLRGNPGRAGRSDAANAPKGKSVEPRKDIKLYPPKRHTSNLDTKRVDSNGTRPTAHQPVEDAKNTNQVLMDSQGAEESDSDIEIEPPKDVPT